MKIQIAAPPVEGRANEELIAFLAKKIGVKKADVCIKSGGASKNKIVAVQGVPTEEAKAILLADAGKK